VLGKLSHAAWETMHERIAAANADDRGIRPGMVSVAQTPTDLLEWSPHVHALVFGGSQATFDAMDFLARLLMHIPQPKLHTVRYYGEYSSVARARRRAEKAQAQEKADGAATVLPFTAERRRLRRAWAQRIQRVYEADPLTCRCGAQMTAALYLTTAAPYTC
jgi:putative transposase